MAGVALALTAVVAVAPGAGAQAPGVEAGSPPSVLASNCPLGSACMYDQSGRNLYTTDGNSGPIWVLSPPGGAWVRNNGYRYPGADHIQVTIFSGVTGYRYTTCLHYGPTAVGQPSPTVADIPAGMGLTGIRWRGECVGNEDDAWWRV